MKSFSICFNEQFHFFSDEYFKKIFDEVMKNHKEK